MAVEFSNSRLPGPPDEWKRFLRAVLAADPHDETDALEFKSSCNLTKKEEVGKHIARSILSMANRDPRAAQREYGGFGIIIVGLTPGRLEGVTYTDPTPFGSLVSGYVGSGADSPIWHPQAWSLDGKDVLVIDVRPPDWGDPMFKLRKGWGNVEGNSVFTRRNAATEPANPDEVAMLVRRKNAKPGSQELPLLLIPAAEPIRTMLLDEHALHGWVSRNIATLLKTLTTSSPRPETDAPAGSASGMSSIIRAVQTMNAYEEIPEKRTEEEFRDQVAQYESELLIAIESLPGTLGAALIPAANMTLANDSDRFFSDVEVDVDLPDGVTAAYVKESVPDPVGLLPKRPEPFGPRYKNMSTIASLRMPAWQNYDIASLVSAQHPFGSHISKTGRARVTETMRDLRPRKSRPVCNDIVFLVPADHGDRLTLDWSATARDVDAVASGTASFALAEPIDLFAIVRDELNERGNRRRS